MEWNPFVVCHQLSGISGWPNNDQLISNCMRNQTHVSSIVTQEQSNERGKKEGWLSVGVVAQWQSTGGLSQRPWV